MRRFYIKVPKKHPNNGQNQSDQQQSNQGTQNSNESGDGQQGSELIQDQTHNGGTQTSCNCQIQQNQNSQSSQGGNQTQCNQGQNSQTNQSSQGGNQSQCDHGQNSQTNQSSQSQSLNPTVQNQNQNSNPSVQNQGEKNNPTAQLSEGCSWQARESQSQANSGGNQNSIQQNQSTQSSQGGNQNQCNQGQNSQTNQNPDVQNQSQSNQSSNQQQNVQGEQSNQSNQDSQGQNNNQSNNNAINIPIMKPLKENINYIKKILGNPDDLIVRELTLSPSNENEGGDEQSNQSSQAISENTNDSKAPEQKNESQSQQAGGNERDSQRQEIKCSIIYISGLTDTNIINENILKMLQSNVTGTKGNLLDEIYQQVISVTHTNKIMTFDDVIQAILSGNTVFLLDGEMTALDMDTANVESRALDEPQSEAVIRGPRLALIEKLDKNIMLIRNELKDPNLRIEMLTKGKRSKQKIAICYVEGIINNDILNEVKRRLNTLNIDYLQDSSTIEQWIEDSYLSPFPQLIDTERLDRVVHSILQGKVVILADGSPYALLAPITLGEAIQSLEDYSQRWMVGTLMRLLRYLAVFISVLLPALYVALVSYHPGMLPTQLTFSIAATREGVPFPSLIEVLLMAITFEILQEAGIRLPKSIGQTVGIVGGIVIGDVAVSAGIVGPSMVIITSLTAIASFTIPNYSMATSLRVLRFVFVIVAAVLGLYGIMLVFIMTAIHIVNLKSMGIPYSGPFAPYFLNNLKNNIIRAPITTLNRRPPYLEPKDMERMDSGGQN